MEKFVVHKDYNRITLDNDIALIILKEPVTIDPTVGTVCLPNPDEDIEDILYNGCYITGRWMPVKNIVLMDTKKNPFSKSIDYLS